MRPIQKHPFQGLSRNPDKFTFEEFKKLIEWSLSETDPEDDRQEEQSLVEWMYELVSELEDVAHFESGSLPPRPPKPPPEHHELHTDTGPYDESLQADQTLLRRLTE